MLLKDFIPIINFISLITDVLNLPLQEKKKVG